MHISILGAGYVGLVTGACLATLGHEVRVIDRDQPRINGLQRGRLPIQEPGLDELVEEHLASGRLSFHSTMAATAGTQFTIVAVGTLDQADEWTAATVRDAVLALVSVPGAPPRIVIRSTLLPGTARLLEDEVQRLTPGVELALSPEFTREGSAVADFFSPDRVVIGVREPAEPSALGNLLAELFEPLGAPVLITDLTSAETIKVASNVFLAAKVAFANEVARLSAAVGADVQAVVDGIGLDGRIGRSFLSPGPGYGGSCFPSQARALPALAEQMGAETPLVAAIDVSNEAHATWYADRIERALGGSLRGARLAILGLTFKAGTDDLRESPALRLAARLADRGAELALYDPTGADDAHAQLGGQARGSIACASALDACRGADAVLVATEWPEFRELEWSTIAGQMNGRIVFDARNVVDAAQASAAGLEVVTHGRQPEADHSQPAHPVGAARGTSTG